MKYCLKLLILNAFALFLGMPIGVAADAWKAGAGRAVITPPEPMWMSGYASRDKPAFGRSTDLWAKVAVLEDSSGERVVLITLDLVGIDRVTSREICDELAQSHGLKRSQIAIATSHTHSGPVVRSNLNAMYGLDAYNQQLVTRYAEFLKRNVSVAVREAFESLAPAVIRYGMGQVSFAVNRRNNREADVPALRSAGQLVGPVDHSAPVLSIRSPEGSLRAVIFGYACHATVLSLFDWSGDWPGFAQIEVENAHPEAIAMFWAGCGADQNPLPRRTVEFAREYGRQMAAGVERVLQSPMPEVQGGLKSAYREIPLALDQLPSRKQIETDVNSTDIYISRRAKMLLRTLESEGKLSPDYPYPVQIWGLGNDVNFVVLGGEVVVDFSLRIRAELPGKQTWIAGYANDVMAYIPSARVLREGGYEGASSMIYYGQPTVWSKDVEEHILRTVHQLHAEIRGQAGK